MDTLMSAGVEARMQELERFLMCVLQRRIIRELSLGNEKRRLRICQNIFRIVGRRWLLDDAAGMMVMVAGVMAGLPDPPELTEAISTILEQLLQEDKELLTKFAVTARDAGLARIVTLPGESIFHPLATRTGEKVRRGIAGLDGAGA